MGGLVSRGDTAGGAALRGLPERAGAGRGGPAMSSYVRWSDIRGELVEQAGGEEAVAAGKQELLAEVTGPRLAEARRGRGLTQQLLGCAPRQEIGHRDPWPAPEADDDRVM